MLRDGRVFADGPKHELVTSARLSALFGLDVEVRSRDGRYWLRSDVELAGAD
jgi:iron complex transport system ATP-binding protein